MLLVQPAVAARHLLDRGEGGVLKERGIAGPKPLFFPPFFFFYSGRRDVIIYTTRAHNVVAVTSSALYKTDCTRVYTHTGFGCYIVAVADSDVAPAR